MLVLHHYAMSPFAEKVRLMLGYSHLAWNSVPAPEFPPRPNIDPLSGGYRRIPIAQSGADIFCDSRLICAEIAAEANKPALDPFTASADDMAYADYLEGEVFWAAVLAMKLGVSFKKLMRSLGPLNTLKFFKDRLALGKSARVSLPKPRESEALFNAHLEKLEQQLQNDFLGGSAPSHLDFAAYHPTWLQREIAEAPLKVEIPGVQAWYQRMSAFGEGDKIEISPEQAFAAARDNEPRAISAEHLEDPRINTAVTIRPSDYGLDGVQGTLVGCSENRWIVARDTGDYGTVHVHFPRRGFELL